jgi:hypothetical protein
MAQAHKATKEFFASVTETGLTYPTVLKIKLRVFHRQYKAECEASPVEWYNVEGHVVCPDTGINIPVGEATSQISVAAAGVLWYVKNFDKHYIRLVAYRENGSVRVEKPNTNYK